MSKRIYFETWGNRKNLRIPAYAMADDLYYNSYRVAESIARANGLEAVNVRPDGSALDRKGRPESNHFQLTLGRACPGGGWNIVTEMWFSIPIPKAAEA